MMAVVLTAALGHPRPARTQVAVYLPLLEDVRSSAPVVLIRPVTLSRDTYTRDCNLHCVGGGDLDLPTLRALRASGVIADWCRVSYGRVSCGDPGHNFVSLGPVIHLAGLRIAPLFNVPPGRGFLTAMDAVPDSLRVTAHAAVDVMVYVPCRHVSEPDACRFQDISMYRYFLQSQADGTYRVVARIWTGAV